MTLSAALFLSRAGGRILWKTGRLYGHTIFSNPATVQIYDAFTHIPLDCGALWILDETAFSYSCHEKGIIGLLSYSLHFRTFVFTKPLLMFLCNKAHGVILWGNGMNENHTMHIQSDSLTFGAQAYISRMLGVLTCSLFTIPFSCCLRLFTQGKKGFHGRSGGRFGVFVFELWFGHNNRRRRASEKESLIVGYTKILGTGSCLCSLRYFVSLVKFFLLYQFSL